MVGRVRIEVYGRRPVFAPSKRRVARECASLTEGREAIRGVAQRPLRTVPFRDNSRAHAVARGSVVRLETRTRSRGAAAVSAGPTPAGTRRAAVGLRGRR